MKKDEIMIKVNRTFGKVGFKLKKYIQCKERRSNYEWLSSRR